MMAQASEQPAPINTVDWLDERSLVGEFMEYALTVEEDLGIEVFELASTSPTEISTDVTFEPLFKAIDESFDLFDLELEFCMGFSSSLPEPLPTLFDFSSQVTTISHTTTELSPREPECQQPQPKRRKKSLQASNERQIQQLQPKKRKPSLKTSSQRQREEIERLRATAIQLEDQLQILRAVNVQGSSSTSAGDAPTESQSLWECVARRQEAARHQSEQTNAALRKHIKTNLKLATSLEQSLHCKRESSDP